MRNATAARSGTHGYTLTRALTPHSEVSCVGPGRQARTNKYPDLVTLLEAARHSIISSARPSSVSGIVRLSALAAFRLMTNSTFVDCCTGKSAGFSPLRIRAV
jgi:hypothetical protein